MSFVLFIITNELVSIKSGMGHEGYNVYTAGKNAKKIEEYIRNQLKEDQVGNR